MWLMGDAGGSYRPENERFWDTAGPDRRHADRRRGRCLIIRLGINVLLPFFHQVLRRRGYGRRVRERVDGGGQTLDLNRPGIVEDLGFLLHKAG